MAAHPSKQCITRTGKLNDWTAINFGSFSTVFSSVLGTNLTTKKKRKDYHYYQYSAKHWPSFVLCPPHFVCTSLVAMYNSDFSLSTYLFSNSSTHVSRAINPLNHSGERFKKCVFFANARPKSLNFVHSRLRRSRLPSPFVAGGARKTSTLEPVRMATFSHLQFLSIHRSNIKSCGVFYHMRGVYVAVSVLGQALTHVFGVL